MSVAGNAGGAAAGRDVCGALAVGTLAAVPAVAAVAAVAAVLAVPAVPAVPAIPAVPTSAGASGSAAAGLPPSDPSVGLNVAKKDVLPARPMAGGKA